MRCWDGFEESEREAISGVDEALLMTDSGSFWLLRGSSKINNLVVNRKERNEKKKSPP